MTNLQSLQQKKIEEMLRYMNETDWQVMEGGDLIEINPKEFLLQCMQEAFVAGLQRSKELVPEEKDISLNEVGTVGDYHTHGFNECHDHALKNIEEEIQKI